MKTFLITFRADVSTHEIISGLFVTHKQTIFIDLNRQTSVVGAHSVTQSFARETASERKFRVNIVIAESEYIESNRFVEASSTFVG